MELVEIMPIVEKLGAGEWTGMVCVLLIVSAIVRRAFNMGRETSPGQVGGAGKATATSADESLVLVSRWVPALEVAGVTFLATLLSFWIFVDYSTSHLDWTIFVGVVGFIASLACSLAFLFVTFAATSLFVRPGLIAGIVRLIKER